MADDSQTAPPKVEVNTGFDNANLLRTEKVVVKQGPRTYKTVSLMYFGDKASGEVKKRSLQAQSYRKKPNGMYDFSSPEYRWYCEDEEILRVQALLNTELPDSGTYQLLAEGSGLDELIRQIQAGTFAPAAVRQLLEALGASDEIRRLLASSQAGQLMASAVELLKQQRALSAIRAVVEEPLSTEPQIQRVLGSQWWMFGGRFIKVASRRGLTVLDQLDIPLIRADGSLHIVELKQANIPTLIVRHRNHLIVGPDVHEAVSQGINYLRSLDEQRATILTELGIDCRRASVTVVIGHPQFVNGFVEQEIAETLRTYNCHLSRIEVITYKELLDGAARSLAIGEQ